MKLIAFLIIFTCILIIRLFIFIIRSACKAVDFIEKPRNTISQDYNYAHKEYYNKINEHDVFIFFVTNLREKCNYPEEYYFSSLEIFTYLYYLTMVFQYKNKKFYVSETTLYLYSRSFVCSINPLDIKSMEILESKDFVKNMLTEIYNFCYKINEIYNTNFYKEATIKEQLSIILPEIKKIIENKLDSGRDINFYNSKYKQDIDIELCINEVNNLLVRTFQRNKLI